VRLFGRLIGIALLAIALIVPPTLAQPNQIIVATGVPNGTYAQFFTEISRVCPQPPLKGVASHGSVENLERVMNNSASLAFVQADVLFAKKLVEHDPLVESVRTFLVLYLEEIHILIKASNDSITKFSDLAGKKVGVYGGSTITSLILYATTGVQPGHTETYPGPDEAVQALGGAIDAVLGVGGKPLPWVESLDAKYKLIPFDQFEKVSKIYYPAIINYSNLNQPGGVGTIAVPSLLITRDYKIPGMVTPLLQLRSCIVKNLEVLRETVGDHPKWNQVNPAIKGPWPYFEGSSN